MEELNEIKVIKKEEFLSTVIQLKMDGWRLVQICAVCVEEGYELSYSFSLDYRLLTLRLLTGEDEKVSSITQIYPCAFMQENEMAELFGVPVEALNLDYHDKLYRIDQEAPFKEKR